MQAQERRRQIMEYLKTQQAPVSATSLAAQFDVSRQIIVGDIALLRSAGNEILATPRGYVCEETINGIEKRIVSLHTAEQMEKELQICVDQGCSVVDVIVEHPVYGQLTGLLNLHSRYEITQFMERVAKESAHALSELTDGVHLHTLRCPDAAAYERVCEALRKEGILLEEE